MFRFFLFSVFQLLPYNRYSIWYQESRKPVRAHYMRYNRYLARGITKTRTGTVIRYNGTTGIWHDACSKHLQAHRLPSADSMEWLWLMYQAATDSLAQAALAHEEA